MAEESILTDEFLRQLISVGESDILVGLPTYNNAETAGPVVQAIHTGLLKYFPRERAVIVNADGGSRDGTRDRVREAAAHDGSGLKGLRTLHCISAEYEGNPSSGSALRAILAAADLLRVSACVILSPESVSAQPDWIDRMLRPVYRDSIDLLMPLYQRHKFDGLLMRTLIYPMTRALYGKKIHEPYAEELAFSGKLGSYFLAQDIWQSDAVRSGAELCLAVAAMAGDFRLAQTFLGAKTHPDRRSPDLVAVMRQTLGALFWTLEGNFALWSAPKEAQSVPVVVGGEELTTEPRRVNRKQQYQMFCSAVPELEPVLQKILLPQTLADLQCIARAPLEQFSYSDELWVRTVYEFASAYHKEVINRDHIVQALAPLYRGKTYTFLAENRDASGDEVEADVERLCLTFERLRPALVELWERK